MNETLFPLPEARDKDNTDLAPGVPRMERANRQQVMMRAASLEELLPEDHRARIVWEMLALLPQGWGVSSLLHPMPKAGVHEIY